MNNNIGIYDETNDISDTIAISDAYVGSDGSSVINMFGVAGRPCFIFNNFLVDECSYQQQHRLNIIGAYILCQIFFQEYLKLKIYALP